MKDFNVEYKRLEDCCIILDNQRKPIKKEYRDNGIYPYYGANGIQDYVSSYIFDGTFILIGEDGSVKTKDGRPIVNWATGKIWVNNHAHILKEKDGIYLRYLYHFIQTLDISEFVHGNIPKLNQRDLRNLIIAVPPIEIQKEIANILDKFTELYDLLNEEQIGRKKQYEHYKSLLLKENDNKYDIAKLKDVAEYSKERINVIDLNQYNYVGVDNLLQNKMGKTISMHIPKTGNSTKYYKNDILIGNIRPYLKKIWFANSDGGTNGDVLVIHIKNEKILPKYLYFILSSDKFFNYANNNSKGGKMPRGNKDKIINYEFYIPSLEEQRKIISILDNFEKICNDLSSGLPAEIEARKKQYEYYRDKLMTF